MLPCPLGVGVMPLGGVDEHAVHRRQRGKVVSHCVPTGLSALPHSLAPPLGLIETPTPVGQVEYCVTSDTLLAWRHDWPEVINSLLVSGGKVGHVIGSRKDNVAPFLQRGTSWAQPVFQFRKEDRVGLLPMQHETPLPRRGAALRPHLLAPLRAFVIELLRQLPSERQEFLITAERLLRHRPAIPQSVMRQVPPNHLH